jgi:hypothetical protein
MGLIQIAIGMAIFAIVAGVGTEHLTQFANSRLPYQTVKQVSSAVGFLNNAISSYVAQNCLQTGSGNCQTPDIQTLVQNGFISANDPRVNTATNTYTTKDGTVISVAPGATAGSYTLNLQPGGLLSSRPAYTNLLVNRLPGSSLNGNTVSVSQPIPAINNLNSLFVQTNPQTVGGTQTINNSGNLIVSGGVQANEGIATNEISPISGSAYINTHNGIFQNIGGLQLAGPIQGQVPSQFDGCAGGEGCFYSSVSSQLCLAPFFSSTVRGGKINGTFTYANSSTSNGGYSYGYVLVPCNAGPQGGW